MGEEFLFARLDFLRQTKFVTPSPLVPAWIALLDPKLSPFIAPIDLSLDANRCGL